MSKVEAICRQLNAFLIAQKQHQSGARKQLANCTKQHQQQHSCKRVLILDSNDLICASISLAIVIGERPAWIKQNGGYLNMPARASVFLLISFRTNNRTKTTCCSGKRKETRTRAPNWFQKVNPELGSVTKTSASRDQIDRRFPLE